MEITNKGILTFRKRIAKNVMRRYNLEGISGVDTLDAIQEEIAIRLYRIAEKRIRKKGV